MAVRYARGFGDPEARGEILKTVSPGFILVEWSDGSVLTEMRRRLMDVDTGKWMRVGDVI